MEKSAARWPWLVSPALVGALGYSFAPSPTGMPRAMWEGSPLERDIRADFAYKVGGGIPATLLGYLAGRKLGLPLLAKIPLAGGMGILGTSVGEKMREAVHGKPLFTPEMFGYGAGTYRADRPHAMFIPQSLWSAYGYPRE